MKYRKITALLCALAIAGTGVSSVFAEDAAAAAPAKDSSAEAAAPAAKVPEVNYTDALLKGLSLTLPDVEKSVQDGTFKNRTRSPSRNRSPSPLPLSSTPPTRGTPPMKSTATAPTTA